MTAMSDYHSYVPADGHELPHDPLKAIVAPRPIGWISTADREGNFNLAPYSFFNLVSSRPPLVMFSSEGWKDTVRNIRKNKEFCCNLATLGAAEQVNATSQEFEPSVNEIDRAGLDAVACDVIAAPRVRNCVSALECRAIEIKTLQPEWTAQVSAASQILISKSDIASQLNVDALRHALARMNPVADQALNGGRQVLRDGFPGAGITWALEQDVLNDAHVDHHSQTSTFALMIEGTLVWTRFVVLWIGMQN